MKDLVEGSVKSLEGVKGTLRAVRLGRREEGSVPRVGWRVWRGEEMGQAAPQVEKDRSASSSGSKTGREGKEGRGSSSQSKFKLDASFLSV